MFQTIKAVAIALLLIMLLPVWLVVISVIFVIEAAIIAAHHLFNLGKNMFYKASDLGKNSWSIEEKIVNTGEQILLGTKS